MRREISVSTEHPALTSNKMKYYTSEMKADINLCASSFSMVALSVSRSHSWSKISSRCMSAALDS